MKNTTQNTYSLIIPVKDNFKYLEKLLYSVDFERYKLLLTEIIVINDGDNDEISKLLSQFNYNIKEIKNKISKGSYYARNLGIKAAKNENIIFADADVYFENNWLEYIEQYINKADYIAFNVKIKGNKKERFCGKFFQQVEFNTDLLFERYKSGITAFLVVKKKVFDRIGGFDSKLFSGGDTEFGNRAFIQGIKQYYCSKIIVRHCPITPKKFFRKKIRIQKGRYDLYKKFPERFPNFNINAKSFFYDFKFFIGSIFLYKKYNLSFFENLLCQSFSFLVFFYAKIVVLIFPNKTFNY